MDQRRSTVTGPETSAVASWKRDWLRVWLTLGHPYSLVTLLLTIAFFVICLLQSDDNLKNILNFATGISAGLTGGFWTTRWSKIAEQSQVDIQAVAAVRDLNALGREVERFRTRMASYKLDSGQPLQADHVAAFVSDCQVTLPRLADQVTMSIQHWLDAAPNINLSSHAEEIMRLNSESAALEQKQADAVLKFTANVSSGAGESEK